MLAVRWILYPKRCTDCSSWMSVRQAAKVNSASRSVPIRLNADDVRHVGWENQTGRLDRTFDLGVVDDWVSNHQAAGGSLDCFLRLRQDLIDLTRGLVHCRLQRLGEGLY